MSIASGIATAPGVSSLLSAPRIVRADLRASAGEPGQRASARKPDSAPSLESRHLSARPVYGTDRAAMSPPSAGRTGNQHSRYVLFIKAVEALRRNYDRADLAVRRDADIRAAGEKIFMIGDGIPRQLQPIDRTFGQRTADDLAKTAEAAKERRVEALARQADAEARAADRAERAAAREAAADRADAKASRLPETAQQRAHEIQARVGGVPSGADKGDARPALPAGSADTAPAKLPDAALPEAPPREPAGAAASTGDTRPEAQALDPVLADAPTPSSAATVEPA